jgi:NodT family efflux transporter outer membrane factor (OMF) lipoprotein
MKHLTMTSSGASYCVADLRPGAVAILAAVALLSGSGCAVGPDFHRPSGPTVTGYTRQPLVPTTASTGVVAGEEQRFVPDRDIPEQWWRLFQSEALNAVVEKALAANPTIVSAQAALRQARELVFAQRGAFYPTVQGTFTGTRQHTSGTLSGVLNSNANEFNLYTAQATVGYAFDVWGGNRRQVESLQAQTDAQRFLLQATYVTLAANVVAAALQEASLRAQIAATQDIIAISTKSLALLRKQFEIGYVAGLDVAAQEAALAQVEQQLPPLQKQLDQNRDLLAVLTGRFPQDDLEEHFELAELHLPQELPVSLPSNLVQQRPDVRVAEETLHAAGAQVGVAIANWLPQFTISATYGGSATDFAQMFAHNNPYWMVGGTVLQTLFDGNTLLHRQRSAAAAFEQAAAQYRNTVLTAVQNVADTLYALQADAASLTAAVAAERAAKRTLDITLRQQQLGYANYLALLSAQQAYQQTVITRVQAQASRFTDTGALFLALGGGWWNRPDAGATIPTAPTAEGH